MLKKIFNIKEYNFRHYNIQAMLAAFLLGFIGLTIIKEVQKAEDKLYEKQILGIVIGVVAALVISLIDYHFMCKFYIVCYLVNIGLLVITRLIGHSYHDAKRWLDIPSIGRVQPSEFTKLLLIIFIAKLFDKYQKKINKIYFLIIACIAIAIPLVLILEQPDLSTTLALLAMFAGMIFLSGISYKLILPVVAVAIPVCAGLWWYIQQDFQLLLHPYQQNRILALKYPDLYPKEMWQQENAAIAIRAGGLAGKFTAGGTGKSLVCRTLPAIESDFIYTAVAEAYGFIGSCVVIGLMVFFIYRAFYVAFRAKDYLGMLLAGGIGCMVGFQTIINICVNTSLFPNTGIPFPFLSAGLSSLLGSYMMVGVLMNVSLQMKERRKGEDDLNL